jgi:hypothetical protein
MKRVSFLPMAVVSVVLLGFCSLSHAQSDASSIWEKMVKAAKHVRVVAISNLYYVPEGGRGIINTWTDGHTLRQEELSTTGPSANARYVPAIYKDIKALMPSDQLKALVKNGQKPMDGPVVLGEGKSYYAIVIRDRNRRQTIWVDPETYLPYRITDEEWKEYYWSPISRQTFEYLKAMPRRKH